LAEIELTQGTIQYREVGSGPPIVLIHGVMVDGTVWDRLLPLLSRDARCIVPDLPLGSHHVAMRGDADLSPHGLARMIAELLERLGLEPVTLVGNDTGGALCQLVCAHHPERVGRVVLVNCDAFENFPPPPIRPLVRILGRMPGAVMVLDRLARSRSIRRASMSMMPLTMKPPPDALVHAWVSPLHDRQVRRDLVRVLQGIEPEVTLDVAKVLPQFDRPALIVWGLRDKFFPLADAERLARTFPNARLERVEDARTFVQLDQPERLATLVREFASASLEPMEANIHRPSPIS
jgi:pimeloyl-ACP methyl ester carboxylesterase